MSEVLLDPAAPEANRGLASLDALAAQAWVLAPPMPHERRHLLRDEAASLLDGLLVRVARGRGALDVALGDGLASLAADRHDLRLGYSCIGDYALERLGIAPRTAQAMARLARELRERPLLREAVRCGELTARKAQAILPVARGEAEATWVERAQVETVRALEVAARAERAAAAEEPDDWDRVWVPLSPEGRTKLDRAMAVAGKVLGAAAPRWQRLEAICQEYLSAHPTECGDEGQPEVCSHPIEEWLAAAKEGLEVEFERWEFLEPAPQVAADTTSLEDARFDAAALDGELRQLAAMRERWDELVGHLAMLVQTTGVWRDMQFATFGHYCAERLGMAERTVEQRASLARRLYALPALREALREGRVSYEQARLVASCADESSVDAWIARAERTPCVALRREIEAAEDAQMCARGEFALRVPRRVRQLLSAAFRAAGQVAGRPIDYGACLERICEHFIETWEPLLKERSTRQRRVLARDRGFCQVPGCSRAAAHAHHVVYRSRGGDDDPENLVALCVAHHLHGVHAGYVRVYGRAPDGLRWEFPFRPDVAPRVNVFTRREACA